LAGWTWWFLRAEVTLGSGNAPATPASILRRAIGSSGASRR
jgi:hypothetical protein